MDNVVKILYYTTSSWNHNCIQSKFRSQKSLQSGLMGLCGCNLKEKLEWSNSIHDGKNWYQIHISRSGERQKICRIVAIKIRGNVLCSGELGGLCCRWNAYHQNLDMIDEMKHLPGAWIWKNVSLCIIRHSEGTWGLLFTSHYCSRKCVGTYSLCSEV